MHISTKTYDHNTGLSCAFRQWRAESHCRFLHGYAIAVRLEFEANELDARGWVVDFGSLKTFKGWLENTFDHKTLVAKDDPHYDWFLEGARRNLLEMVTVQRTGMEAFSELIRECAEIWLMDNGYAPRVRVRRVEVMEHPGNSALSE